jgi:hypothetical protein
MIAAGAVVVSMALLPSTTPLLLLNGVDSFSSSKMKTHFVSTAAKRRRKRARATTTKPTTSSTPPTTQLFLSTTLEPKKNNPPPPPLPQDAKEIYDQARAFAFQDMPLKSKKPKELADVITGDQYDLHYHSVADERKQLKRAQYWLNEIDSTLCTFESCNDEAYELETIAKLEEIIQRHTTRIAIRTSKGSESKVPLISAELGAGSLIAILALFIVALDVVALHGDEVGPIENYQQFFDIVQEKQYLANVFARYF